MPAVQEMKGHLYHELELAIRTTKRLLSKIKAEDWNYRPRDNMRSLQELAHHLVLVPITDLAILQEKTEEEVHQYCKEIDGVTDAEELSKKMDLGYQALRTYMDGLSEEDFLHKQTKAFYLDFGKSQAAWLTEIVTHTFHHRAQLFNYLKQLGYDVTMFDLY